jgi:tRNA-modifying protein YgfZ
MTTPLFEEQYDASRSGCCVFDLAGWSSVSITGSDRRAFLHNFCTNDVKELAPGASCEAFVLNVKGRILGHGVISCHDDELVFFGAPGQAARVIEHLDRYIIREDVQLRGVTEERAYLLVAGGASARECCEAGVLSVRSASPRRVNWRIVASDFFSVLELADGESQPVIDALVVRGYAVAGAEAFTALRIEAGFPLIGIDFDEHNFPQEVGRDREAISFTKGCYLGQETVARIDALGHVNQRLVCVRFGGRDVPAVGTVLSHASKPVGRVTSATLSPRLGAPLALAMVRREHTAVGGRLESPLGEVEIVALPL